MEFSRIFVTVGFGPDFSRLIREVDQIAPRLTSQITMQIGNTEYEPRHVPYFRFASSISEYIEASDLVISHGGITLVEIIRNGKPVVVVPRQKQYREHINDHQVEFVRTLAGIPGIKIVYDIEDLEEAIASFDSIQVDFDDANRIQLVKRLHSFLRSIDESDRLR